MGPRPDREPGTPGCVLFVEPADGCRLYDTRTGDGRVYRTDDWSRARDALVSAPPCGLLVCGLTLSEPATATLRWLNRRGIAPTHRPVLRARLHRRPRAGLGPGT